jgi:hypothetical protein
MTMAEHKAPAHEQAQQQPKQEPPKKPLTEFGGKKIVARRAARQGDDGYQLSTLDEQVTIILEDGSEKVLKGSDLFEPTTKA